MGSISNVPNGITYLTQFVDSVAKSPASQSIGKILQSATPSDAAKLSNAALQLQQVTGIFGLAAPQSTAIALPAGVTGPQLPSGVSASDVANATPEQQAAIVKQAQALQQVQNLFYPPTGTPGNLNVLA